MIVFNSMADNQSKELAFESVALISKALCLLEAGQLGIVSFGEHVRLLHPLQEQFSDYTGPRFALFCEKMFSFIAEHYFFF